MCSDIGLDWLKDSVIPEFFGGVLVKDRASLHLFRTPETAPAGCQL